MWGLRKASLRKVRVALGGRGLLARGEPALDARDAHGLAPVVAVRDVASAGVVLAHAGVSHVGLDADVPADRGVADGLVELDGVVVHEHGVHDQGRAVHPRDVLVGQLGGLVDAVVDAIDDRVLVLDDVAVDRHRGDLQVGAGAGRASEDLVEGAEPLLLDSRRRVPAGSELSGLAVLGVVKVAARTVRLVGHVASCTRVCEVRIPLARIAIRTSQDNTK